MPGRLRRVNSVGRRHGTINIWFPAVPLMDSNLLHAIASVLDFDPDVARWQSVTGGSIASAYRIEAGARRVFVKCLDPTRLAVLETERAGLAALAATDCVATPAVEGLGCSGDKAWLALEWLDLKPPDADCFARFGLELARLHRQGHPRFGFEHDNFLGPSPQRNTWFEDWSAFFAEHRLAPQLERLAHAARGFGGGQCDRVVQSWREHSATHRPAPSLLHGDLWRGNVAMLGDGRAVVFDPAVHYGDRECDLAMADLFGGFDPGFFSAYRGAWPLPDGWRERRRFYQLYHLLNHANLFGGHYIEICRKLIDRLGHATTSTDNGQ